MGQKLSTLRRKVLAVKADTPRQSNIDGSLSRITSPEDECAVQPSSVIESVQSGIIRTSSQTSDPIRESDSDTIPKGLLKLSTELILEIAEYLPSSGYMSLSYSCRRIRNGMGASIEHVLGDKLPMGRRSATALSIEMRNVRSLERLEWRRMLDRDGKVPSPRAFCSGCMLTHDRSLFSIQSLNQPSTRRRCLGSAGRVWICPHLSLDHDQVMEFLREPGHNWVCERRPSTLYYERCSFGIRSTGSFITFWPIIKMPRDGLPSNQDVEEALRVLKAPLCPHLRLNDACVAGAYLKDRANLQRDFCRHPSPDFRGLILSSERLVCIFCGISIQFLRNTLIGPPEMLTLITLRTLMSLRGCAPWSCTDRDWICQVADPADIEEYEEAWNAANVECRRKVIC